MKYFKSLVKHNFPLQQDCEIFFSSSCLKTRRFFPSWFTATQFFFVARSKNAPVGIIIISIHRENWGSCRRPRAIALRFMPNTWLWNYVRTTRRYKSQHEIHFFSASPNMFHSTVVASEEFRSIDGAQSMVHRDSPSEMRRLFTIDAFRTLDQTRIPIVPTHRGLVKREEKGAKGQKKSQRMKICINLMRFQEASGIFINSSVFFLFLFRASPFSLFRMEQKKTQHTTRISNKIRAAIENM